MPTVMELLVLYSVCEHCRQSGMPPGLDVIVRDVGNGLTLSGAGRMLLSLVQKNLLTQAKGVIRSIWPAAAGWRLAGMPDEALFEEAIESRPSTVSAQAIA